MSATLHREQVSLLLRVLPILAREEVLALKGGTAINLFVRDLPRLSVNIDLTFLPLVDRDAALTAIDAALQRAGSAVKRQIPGASVRASKRLDAPKLFVEARGARVTIEPNATLRGSVFPAQESMSLPLNRRSSTSAAHQGMSTTRPVIEPLFKSLRVAST